MSISMIKDKLQKFFSERGKKAIISAWATNVSYDLSDVEKVFLRLDSISDNKINKTFLSKFYDKVYLVRDLHTKMYLNLTKKKGLIGSANFTINSSDYNEDKEFLFWISGEDFLEPYAYYLYYSYNSIPYREIIGKILKIENNNVPKIKGVIIKESFENVNKLSFKVCLNKSLIRKEFEKILKDIETGKINSTKEINERFKIVEKEFIFEELEFAIRSYKIININELKNNNLEFFVKSKNVIFFEAELIKGKNYLIERIKDNEMFILRNNLTREGERIDYDVIKENGALIVGHSGMGKTTLLKNILYNFSKEKMNILIFDSHSVFDGDLIIDMERIKIEEDIDEKIEEILKKFPDSPFTTGSKIVVLRNIKNDYKESNQIKKLNEQIIKLKIKLSRKKDDNIVIKEINKFVKNLKLPKDFLEKYYDSKRGIFIDITHTEFLRRLNERLIEKIKKGSGRRFILIIDEAHIYLPEDISEKRMDNPFYYLASFLVKEGRKFNARIILSTQRLHEISKPVSVPIPVKIIFNTDPHPSLRGIKIPKEKGEFNFYYGGKQKILNLNLSIFEDKRFEEIVIDTIKDFIKDSKIKIDNDYGLYIVNSKNKEYEKFIKEVQRRIGKSIFIPPNTLPFEEIISIYLNILKTIDWKTKRKGIRRYIYIIRNQKIIEKISNFSQKKK